MTFSVLAHDAATGDVGAATASLVLAVGARVPVVVGGRGAAVVQGGAPQDVRSLIRAELESGWTAADIVAGLAADGLPDDAQIGVVDAAGGVGVHNGPALEKHVAVAQGHGVLVAANLMERPDVADAALDSAAPRLTTAPLAEVLLEALAVSDDLGGDLRGRMSAALTVHGSSGSSVEDLRVDDDPRPVRALRYLHQVYRAHDILERSRTEHGAYTDLDAVRDAHRIAPDDPVCLGALTLALLRAGAVEDAEVPARALLAVEPRTAARLRRSAAAGRLDPESVEQLLHRAGQPQRPGDSVNAIIGRWHEHGSGPRSDGPRTPG